MPSSLTSARTQCVFPFPGGPRKSAPRRHGRPCVSYASRDAREAFEVAADLIFQRAREDELVERRLLRLLPELAASLPAASVEDQDAIARIVRDARDVEDERAGRLAIARDDPRATLFVPAFAPFGGDHV